MTPGPNRKPQPEWVGEGEDRRNIAELDDRGVAKQALDVGLRIISSLRRHSDEVRRFLDDTAKRDEAILKDLTGLRRRVDSLELGPVRDEAISHHDWNEAFEQAGREISRRVKDPKDRLDSERARAIAQEVVEGAKTVNDAKMFRWLKAQTGTWGLEALKWLALLLAGAIAAHYGLHL